MREVREEIGLEAREVRFNHSHYFAPSNTLMLNFTVTVDDEEAHPNWEVDSWTDIWTASGTSRPDPALTQKTGS